VAQADPALSKSYPIIPAQRVRLLSDGRSTCGLAAFSSHHTALCFLLGRAVHSVCVVYEVAHGTQAATLERLWEEAVHDEG